MLSRKIYLPHCILQVEMVWECDEATTVQSQVVSQPWTCDFPESVYQKSEPFYIGILTAIFILLLIVKQKLMDANMLAPCAER